MFKYVVMAIIGVVAIIFAVNVIKGIIKGLKKTVGSLISIVLSAITSLIVTAVLCKPSSPLVLKGLEALKGIFTEGAIHDLFTVEELGAAFSYYSVMLVSPFFFAILFVITSVIFSLIVAAVWKAVPILKNVSPSMNHWGGAALGILCGILVSVIVITPVVGTIDVVSAADTLASQNDAEENELSNILHDAADSEAMHMLMILCRPEYDLLASSDFFGERVYLTHDVVAILDMIENVSHLSGNISEFDDEQIESIRKIVADIESSPILENAAAGVFSAAAKKWTSGESFLGIEKIEAGGTLDPMIHAMLEVMATSDRECIGKDLETVADVFALLVKHGIIEAQEAGTDLLSKLSQDGVISDFLITINKNSRMAPLADEMVNLSIKTLASIVEIPSVREESTPEDKVTVEDILSEISSFADCTNIEGEANAIEDVIIVSLTALSSTDFSRAGLYDILEVMGVMLDDMSNTQIFSEKTSAKLLKAIVQSENVYPSLGLSYENATEFADNVVNKVNTTHMTYSSATKAVAGTFTALKSAADKDMSDDEKSKTVNNLINSVDVESADMIGSMLSSSMIESLGVRQEHSESVTSTISTMIDNIAKYNENSNEEEEIAKEADAISQILNMAISVSSESTGGTMFNNEEEEGALGCNAEELVEIIVNSEVITATLNQTVYENGYGDNPLGLPEMSEADRAQAEAAIESYFANNGGGEDLAATLEAIAAMVNVNVNLGE